MKKSIIAAALAIVGIAALVPLLAVQADSKKSTQASECCPAAACCPAAPCCQ